MLTGDYIDRLLADTMPSFQLTSSADRNLSYGLILYVGVDDFHGRLDRRRQGEGRRAGASRLHPHRGEGCGHR